MTYSVYIYIHITVTYIYTVYIIIYTYIKKNNPPCLDGAGCATLAPAQVVVRHYGRHDGAGSARSFRAHSDHLAFATAVLDLTPVTWSMEDPGKTQWN
jgi:hypothetical protein